MPADGSPQRRKRFSNQITDLDALRARTEPDTNGGCWLWTGALTSQGYGKFMVAGSARMAHRAALELSLGQALPPGVLACHRCDTPACINPDHIFAGTPRDNIHDMVRKGRGRYRFSRPPASSRPSGYNAGAINGSAKLTEAAAIEVIAAPRSIPSTVLARHFGVSDSAIRECRLGYTWRHLHAC